MMRMRTRRTKAMMFMMTSTKMRMMTHEDNDEDNEFKDDKGNAFNKLKQTFNRDPVLIYLM